MSVAQEYTLIIQWSDEDQLYLAYSPELPGCITHGRTYLEAAEMGVEAMELWCDVTLSAGEPLPLPQRYDATASSIARSSRKEGRGKTSRGGSSVKQGQQTVFAHVPQHMAEK